MRRLGTGVFGSRLAVAITSAIVTTVVVAGGIAVASVPNNSVGSRKIINNSIRSEDIRNGAVKGIDIRNGTVKGIDIGNGTITSADFAGGGFEFVEGSGGGTASNQFTVYAECPAGKRAVAGGGKPNLYNGLRMVASQPAVSGSTGLSRWVVVWQSDGPLTRTMTTWALCAPEAVVPGS